MIMKLENDWWGKWLDNEELSFWDTLLNGVSSRGTAVTTNVHRVYLVNPLFQKYFPTFAFLWLKDRRQENYFTIIFFIISFLRGFALSKRSLSLFIHTWKHQKTNNFFYNLLINIIILIIIIHYLIINLIIYLYFIIGLQQKEKMPSNLVINLKIILKINKIV